MSGHNPPHGRLGQPNTSWNPLQVPSYVPRQPQLAHMSSERPIARSPLTWHTPPTHQDKMYRCTTGNLMNTLEINPLLQGYSRNVGMPLGSVDLTLSSASRNTPSPKATHSNVQPASLSSKSPQSCSSSSTLPSNIPNSSNVHNMAGDSGNFSSNHQIRTSTSTNVVSSSGGVIQSTNKTEALKEGTQKASYMEVTVEAATNCFGGTNSISDSTSTSGVTCITGGNGYGADLSSRAANDLTTPVTGGLLIKDAKQINSEMGSKNGRDCFPHLAAADSADLVKEFIMQTMQSSNALSVAQKRTSPVRSALQPNLSPNRSRSSPLNLLFGATAMDGKLGTECLSTANLPVTITNTSAPLLLIAESKGATNAIESTDSGNSSAMGSLLSGMSGSKADATASNDPVASPTNNSITSSEDSVDSLNGRNNLRRRRKPERTSKMNTPSGAEKHVFLSIEKSIAGAVAEELEPLRPANALRGDISALAIESIKELGHGLTGNNGPSTRGFTMNSTHHGGHTPLENHKSALLSSLKQHDILIQSNIGSSSTKADPSIHASCIAEMDRIGTTCVEKKSPKSASSTVFVGDLSMSAAVNAAQKKITTEDTSNFEETDKTAELLSCDANRSVIKSEESCIGNGIAFDRAPPEISCNGPTQLKNVQQGKIIHKHGNRTNASDSSYEEVENKLEEMFAGIEEQSAKNLDETRIVARNNGNNGCHNLVTANQIPSNTRTLTSTVTDGDVLKQLSSNSIPNENMKNTTLPDRADTIASAIACGKKPLTPAQKRGNGEKSLAVEILTSTPTAKRKRAPKKKSNAHGKAYRFSYPEDSSPISLKAPTPKKKEKKGKLASLGGGEEGGGRSISGLGKKGKTAKGKGGSNNNERAPSSATWSATAASIETNGKHKGPYVQVKSDGSHTVINTPLNEDDGEKAQNKTKKFCNILNSSERSKIRGLHVSTLSTKYDADTTDASWMCVFCKTGPHKFRLGDLFGPYIISTTSSEFQQSQVDMDYFSVKRTRGSLESQQAHERREQEKQQHLLELGAPKSKKRKNTASAPGPSSSKVATMKEEKKADDQKQLAMTDIFYGMIKASNSTYEVWTHEDCLVWAPGVYMVGTRIVGLEAAIWNCCRHQCELCTRYGAVVSCLRQGCSTKAHFICAHKQNWEMSPDFQSFCEMHSGKEALPLPSAHPTTSTAAASTKTTNELLTKQSKKELKSAKDATNAASNAS